MMGEGFWRSDTPRSDKLRERGDQLSVLPPPQIAYKILTFLWLEEPRGNIKPFGSFALLFFGLNVLFLHVCLFLDNVFFHVSSSFYFFLCNLFSC